MCSPAQVGGPEAAVPVLSLWLVEKCPIKQKNRCDRPEFPGVSACGQYTEGLGGDFRL